MKEVIIKNRHVRLLESAIKSSAPILRIIDTCPICNCKVFPTTYIKGYVDRIVNNRFYTLLNSLSSFEDLNKINDADTIKSAISQRTKKCQTIAQPIRPHLEKVIEECINDIFPGLSENTNYTCKVVDSVKPNHIPNIKAPDGYDIDYNSIDDIHTHQDNLEHRFIINAIIEGGATELVESCDRFISSIHRINPELSILYRKISILKDLILFYEPTEYKETDLQLPAIVEVTFRGLGNKPKIEAQGVTAYDAFRQSIKGALEVFASHGLPDDTNEANYILANSEYLEAEDWYRIFGPSIWQMLFNDVDIDTEDIPVYIMSLCTMDITEATNAMREIFAGTKLGKEKREELVSAAKEYSDYNSFEDRISVRNDSNEQEDSFTPEELERFRI